MLQGGILAGLYARGYGLEALACWILPARVAMLLLAFSFDYLPHRPHKITADEDRFRATHVFPNPLLTPLLLFQNYHLIHHLYPAVPFYRYGRIWRATREDLCGRGVHVQSFLGTRS
jgi:fatty acid desaturase